MADSVPLHARVKPTKAFGAPAFNAKHATSNYFTEDIQMWWYRSSLFLMNNINKLLRA
jgi:hypothetical protein